MNFMFEWKQQYLRSEIFFLPREHKIHIFELTCNVFLLCKHSDDCDFDDFPKIFDHFPKVFKFLQQFPKVAKDIRGRPEAVSMIHQRI